MSYDIRLQRRVDWAVWAAAVTFGLFALHEVQGATAPTGSGPATSRPVTRAAATAAVATLPTPEALHRQECGDCHLAFAPRLLPASTWRQVMAGLDRHFGVDASLDAATATAISDWLSRGAASPARASRQERGDDDGREREPRAPVARPDAAAALRITTTPWFVREHREVPAATWKRAAIGSAAHCEACHTDAGQGRFSERALRIPN